MSSSERAPRSQWPRPVTILLLVAAIVGATRLGVAVYRAPDSAKGDFAATLPGAYVKTLNPALWNSPDLAGSRGYQREIYVYGPTQYLVLYPVAFLNSYAQIARALGVAYAGVLGWSLYLMAGLLDARRRVKGTLLLVIALTLLFPPVYQAYIQREFELVVLLCLVASARLLVGKREGLAGALLGVITWFKVWPIAFLGYLLVKRRFRGAAAFVVASGLTLGAAQLLFGLDRFTIFNPSIVTSNPVKSEYFATSLVPVLEEAWFFTDLRDSGVPIDRGGVGHGFCKNWYESEETVVSAKWAVCRLAFTHSWVSAMVVFFALALLAASYAVRGFVGIERARPLTEHEARWSTVCEMSLVTIAAALVLSAHYYYFIYLTLPVSALALRYLRDREWLPFAWLTLAYLLLAAFLVPLSVMQRYGVDFWRFYVDHVLYFYGELIIIALLLREYLLIGARHRDWSPAPAARLRGALP